MMRTAVLCALCLMLPLGSAFAQLTGKIAYISGRVTFYNALDIHVMDPDGSNVVNLTDSGEISVDPGWTPRDISFNLSWSPDGRKLAYKVGRDIFSIDLESRARVNLTNGDGFNKSPSWSPNGAKIVFMSTIITAPSGGNIFVMNADGSNRVQLTETTGIDGHPQWSPDGSKIAFHSARDGNIGIYVMNADGSSPRRLTDDEDADMNPVWSPNGSRIAFDSGPSSASRLNGSNIFVMNSDGSNIIQLTFNESFDAVAWPTWSPDGTTIAYGLIVGDPGNSAPDLIQVQLLDLASGEVTPITNPEVISFWPAWSPGKGPSGTQVEAMSWGSLKVESR